MRIALSTGLALLLAWLAPAAAAEPAAAPDTAAPIDAAQDIDRVIAERMREAGLVGVGAAVIVDRRLVWSKGYGYADKQAGIAFTPDTLMNIGSISKTFTGVAMMQAVQAGRLSLDADVNRYLPFKLANPAFPDRPITLRQLATHTSGIVDRWQVYEQLYHWGGDSPEPLGEFLRGYFEPGGRDYSPDNFVAFAPGTHREYSNIGAALAGYIVERATGKPLNVYTRERIFAPLQMRRSGWLLAEVPAQSQSTLYVSQDGFAIPIAHYSLATYPDGGVRTSVAELSRFFIALLDGGRYDGARILAPAATAEMLRFQYTAANKPDNVELKEKNSGLFWATKFDVTRIGHGGSDPGVKTEMLASLDKDIAIVFFTNTSVTGPAAKVYAQLVEDLWRHAQRLKREAAAPRARRRGG